MAVQTLVENSVKYAVSPHRGGARISVRAERTSAGVRLSVEDDGPGFDGARYLTTTDLRCSAID